MGSARTMYTAAQRIEALDAFRRSGMTTLGVSRREVEKTLTEEGVAPVKRRKRRRMKRTIHRFERAKPMQMWQSDITQFVCPRTEKKVFLCVFLDDCARYVTGWSVAARQTTEMVIEAYETGVLRYGRPAECLTDQGRQYAAWRGKTEFQAKLRQDGVKHTLSRPHHPETLGKCERLWETMREEFWELVEVVDVEDAKERLAHWFGFYNHVRPHQGLDNATPAERFFGTEEASRKAIGEEQVAISADRGGLIVSTGDGTKRTWDRSPFSQTTV